MEEPGFLSPGHAFRRENTDFIFTGRGICEERDASWPVTTGTSVLRPLMEALGPRSDIPGISEMWKLEA